MRAYYATASGGPEVMRVGDLPDPAARSGEVLVEVRASSVNPVDWKVRGLRVPLVFKYPRVFGCDVAGVVRALGAGVTSFREGDAVYGYAPVMFGHPGAHAERIAIAAKRVRRLPEGLGFDAAAALPVAALTALNGLRPCGALKGREVVVNGATGGVGHFALQLAKAQGAVVTAVCSARNAARATELGADRVIDYKAEDFTRGARRYQVVFDAFGQLGLEAAARVLEPGGAYVTTLGNPRLILRGIWAKVAGGPRVVLANMRDKPEDYATLERHLAAGQVKPIIGQVFGLDQAAEAFLAGERGGTVGKIIITMEARASA